MAKVGRTPFSIMDAYNRFRSCPKCGKGLPIDKHQPAVVPHTPEHIKRRCTGCGYVWNERPVS